ncbi:Haloacid Dehalogenase Superfamily Class (subfamily) IIA [Lachnospiraceae bacterium G11]|nr:Haloacid Dehalogenase Superfamily Class (subfamily) IIA [Lachnospiraceae bacterium G11]
MIRDYFNTNADDLLNKKLFLFDMDGTIYEEDRIFDGTIDLLNLIKERGGRYIFITNNSSKSVVDYIDKVAKMGIKATEEDFFTSSQATALFFKKKYPNDLIYCQGTRSLIAELRSKGLNVTEKQEDGVKVVLTGFDTELNFEKLRNTCQILTERDVDYYATNPDLVCPVSFGFVPDNGSVAIMIKNATGKYPTFIGKPETMMVDICCEKFGVSKDDAVIIGDRLYTDIQTGINAKMANICVLTGEATLKDIEEGDIKPMYVFESVRVLHDLLAKAGSPS